MIITYRKASLIVSYIMCLIFIACEPSPKILPIGDYEIIKLVDTPEDVIYPFFFDENKIIFYSRNSDLNYKICQTDTLGTNIIELFTEQSHYIEQYPVLNNSCSMVAYTMGDFVEADINELKLVHIIYHTPSNYRPERVRMLQQNVYIYNIASGKTIQITDNDCSLFVRWLSDNSMLLVVFDKDTAIVMQTDRRLIHGENSIGWSWGFEVVHIPKEYQTVSLQNDSMLSHKTSFFSPFNKKIERPEDIALITDSLLYRASLFNEVRENAPDILARIKVKDKTQYEVIWADSSKAILTYWFKDARDRFREKFDIILVDMTNYTWTTILKGVPKDLITDIRISEDNILTADGKYRIGKVAFDGKSDCFLQVNEATGIHGMSASPSGRMFVISAWVGKDGSNLYLIKKKDN